MRAAVYSEYGAPEVLQIVEMDKPSPKENEILIKTAATSVTAVDSIFRSGNQFFARLATGILKPKAKILGTEFSGTVESVGTNVKLFNPGDEIFGQRTGESGTHAEYILLHDNQPIISKPENLSFEEASVLPYGFLTALPFLRDEGKIKNGDKILIIGAAGAVGSYAVQLAKYFGAEVTGVCSSSSAEFVKSLGADTIIDYTTTDFTENEESYDIIFDSVGKSSFSESKKVLKKNGIFLTTFISFSILFQMLLTSLFGSKKAVIAFTGMRKPEEQLEDLKFLKELLNENKIKPLIDKIYTFDQIAEAHEYVDKGHKKGNVVIRIYP